MDTFALHTDEAEHLGRLRSGVAETRVSNSAASPGFSTRSWSANTNRGRPDRT
jgi:hypothetical protein